PYFSVRNGSGAAVTCAFTVAGTVTTPTNAPILIQPQDTHLDIAVKVAAAINAQPSLGLTASNLLDGRIHLGGRGPSANDPGHLLDLAHTAITSTGQAGVEGNLVMHLPGGQIMRLPQEGGALGGVRDGDTFVIFNGSQLVTFEFDSNGVVNNGNAVAIPFANSPAPS